jgi:drug/metabolite transporter (DMT)-like permease
VSINWLLVGVIALNLLFSTIGDVFAKLWGLTDNMQWLYIGLAVNVVTIFLFMLAVKIGGLALNTTVILILTIMINVLLGFFIFHEKIGPIQWAGIALGLVSVVLVLNLFKIS